MTQLSKSADNTINTWYLCSPAAAHPHPPSAPPLPQSHCFLRTGAQPSTSPWVGARPPSVASVHGPVTLMGQNHGGSRPRRCSQDRPQLSPVSTGLSALTFTFPTSGASSHPHHQLRHPLSALPVLPASRSTPSQPGGPASHPSPQRPSVLRVLSLDPTTTSISPASRTHVHPQDSGAYAGQLLIHSGCCKIGFIDHGALSRSLPPWHPLSPCTHGLIHSQIPTPTSTGVSPHTHTACFLPASTHTHSHCFRSCRRAPTHP